MSAHPIETVVIVGSDTTLWLAAAVLRNALRPAGLAVEAVELPATLRPADVHATLPPLEALHAQLRIDEKALLRSTGGAFSLGQNFTDTSGAAPAFLHAYGSCGAPIEDREFFAYWLKARRHGLAVPLDDFSLTASAARHGRLMIPDDETDRYGRADYGYHLPALAYARSLKMLAIRDGVRAHETSALGIALDPDRGTIKAVELEGGRRIEGQLFIDATADARLIGRALGVRVESWRDHFPVDRVLAATGPRFASIPIYAEVRVSEGGWTALHPTQAATHVVHAYASASASDEEAAVAAARAAGMPIADIAIRSPEPGRRESAWAGNCVAIGAAACTFDPVHGVDLHAAQLGLVHLLSFFPAGTDHAAERAEYNRIMRSGLCRLRDFQSAHYALNRYGDAPFWTAAREAALPAELAQDIATFRARGLVAPREDESFSPDSWRALFVGHGTVPESYIPAVDTVAADMVKEHFRRMLGFVRDQVMRQPTHDQYLDGIGGASRG